MTQHTDTEKLIAKKYGVEIEVQERKVSIPLAVKNYGVPFFYKRYF